MPVGVIYGTAESTRFDLAVSDASLRRLDYISVHDGTRDVLCQVDGVVRKSSLSFDDAMQGADAGEDRLSAAVNVVGFRDQDGRVQVPRNPFSAGMQADRAPESLVTEVLGLEAGDGAYLGLVKGTDIRVRLSMNMLAQKHVSVLAKTGAGKSYTVGVLLEEFLQAGVPLVILDPHGEYGSLRSPNMDQAEMETMRRFGVKPKAFQDKIQEFAIDTALNREAERLVLEGMNLEGREIVDLLGGKLSGGQIGVLYQAVKDVKDSHPAYTLQDVMDAVQQNKSSAKWNVLNALEALDATGLFKIRGTPVDAIVQPGKCTIVNLKGIPPDVQEVVVTRVTNMLWEARKRDEVPPHILVVEEAHNFCPERGIGNAVSGPVLRTVASEGRKFGMGLVIVSQRPAKIDKNVLSQCNTQFVLKVTNPNDLKAIVSSVEGITTQTADEVQRLPVGSALVAGGGLMYPVFVDVRPRITRHGGRSVMVVRKTSNSPKSANDDDSSTQREPESIGRNVSRKVLPAPPVRRPQAETKTTSPGRPPSTDQKPGERPRESRPVPQARDGEGRTPPSDQPPVRRPAQEDPSRTGRPPEEDAPPPSWTKKDAPGIHRVAHRLGLVSADQSPDDTILFLQRLAKQNGRDPKARLALYAEIARRACHDEPACIRCPMRDPCEHHATLQAERQKTRTGIRRLWSR